MDERISQIETMWTMIHKANEGRDQSLKASQTQFLGIYGPAARQYLLGAVRDPHVADDLFQEFALRFLRGDLRNADPTRGNFRNYLKSILYRLVADHYRRDRKQHQPLEAMDPAMEQHLSVDAARADRRDALLEAAWAKLQQLETESGRPFYSVLRLRADQPNLRSAQMAEILSRRLDQHITQTNVRVMLHRARERFERILVGLVANSLESPTVERIEEELASLQLLDQCRSAVQSYAGRE